MCIAPDHCPLRCPCLCFSKTRSVVWKLRLSTILKAASDYSSHHNVQWNTNIEKGLALSKLSKLILNFDCNRKLNIFHEDSAECALGWKMCPVNQMWDMICSCDTCSLKLSRTGKFLLRINMYPVVCRYCYTGISRLEQRKIHFENTSFGT